VAEGSVSRIDEPAVCERFSVRYKCAAAASSVACVGVERERSYGLWMVGGCRLQHQSFNICMPLGAAQYRIAEPRPYLENSSPFALVACHATLRRHTVRPEN
jgi:hypothetical protein